MRIPASLERIGALAFKDCLRLETITVDAGNTAYKSVDGILYSADGKELICVPPARRIVNINIPEGVETIADYACAYYKETLLEVTIPESVKKIGDYAFYSPEHLMKVTFSENSNLEYIGEYAFYGCRVLTDITLPESITHIGKNAFASCNVLTIHCEVQSKPDGWHEEWAPGVYKIIWGS